MAIKTTPYNSFDYCISLEEVNDCLSDAFIEDDPRITLIALKQFALKRGNLDQLAEAAGADAETLRGWLSADGNPSWLAMMRVIRALGLRLVPVCDQAPFPLAAPPEEYDEADEAESAPVELAQG